MLKKGRRYKTVGGFTAEIIDIKGELAAGWVYEEGCYWPDGFPHGWFAETGYEVEGYVQYSIIIESEDSL